MQLFILFLMIQFIQCTISIFDTSCPVGRQWIIRAMTYCISSKGDYTCLFDSIKHRYTESCNGPKSEPPGEKTVVNRNYFDTVPCVSARFQPFSFTSNQGSDCVYKKAMCTEEGQFAYSNGSGNLDRRCRCDHNQGFAFVTAPGNDSCSCNPVTHDCSCYHKKCIEGQILAPDYQCINEYLEKPFWRAVDCREVPAMKKKKMFDSTEGIRSKTEKQMNDLPVHNARTVAILTTVLVVLLFLIVSLFVYKRQQQDNTVKCKNIVVVGDGSCGKTCLLTVFHSGHFPEEYHSTVFDDIYHSIDVNGKRVQLKLYDTPGQESYAGLRPLSYPKADVFLVCFAVDNHDSFANVSSVWKKDLEKYPHVPRILVGNKIDIRKKKENEKPCISFYQAVRVKNMLGMTDYVECSAKLSEGIEHVFTAATRAACQPKCCLRRFKIW